MGKRSLPALKSCKDRKRRKTNPDDDDRLTRLPDDIQLEIWSRLTLKEAAAASVISHKCKHMWHMYPFLNFKGLLLHERPNFIARIDSVIKHHLGPAIDEFRVPFDLGRRNQSVVDRWLVFAFAKQVKSLELYRSPRRFVSPKPYELKMPAQYQLSPNFKPALTSLSLSFVSSTAQVFECFLSSFPFLEILRLTRIFSLTSIRACSLLSLKRLELNRCIGLQSIDVFVPHLLSFSYQGSPAKLHLKNASSLSSISIGSLNHSHIIDYAIDFVLIYWAQLEYLELKASFSQCNLEANKCYVFTNLKHLSLCLSPNPNSTLLGWTPLIKACPVLQKLTLKLDSEEPCDSLRGRTIRKVEAHAFSCLKTLEIVGLLGNFVDMELIVFVLENAPMLEEVIVDAQHPYFIDSNSIPNPETHKRALKLKRKLKRRLPQSAKLIFK